MKDFDKELQEQKSIQLKKNIFFQQVAIILLLAIVIFSLVAVFFGTDNVNEADSQIDEWAEGAVSSSPKDFQELYSSYVDDYKYVIEGVRESPRFYLAAESVINGIENSLAYSSRGDYVGAVKKIKAAIDAAEQIKKKISIDLEAASTKLKEFYSDIKYQDFVDEMDLLQEHHATSTLYQEWQSKKNDLKEIDHLNKQLYKAESENKYKSQLRIIHKILSIDSSFTAFNDKKKKVQVIIDEMQFVTLMRRVDSDLQKGAPFSALKSLNLAKAIFPTAVEIQDKSYAIQEMIESIKVRELERKISDLRLSDNWLGQIPFYQDLLQLRPSNASYSEGLSLASQIARVTDILVTLNQSPLRLSDDNVSKYTLNIFEEARAFKGKSNTLDIAFSLLKNNYFSANEKKTINLFSNGKTNIEIKRLGLIKPFYERAIDIKPGEYVFILTCKGYKQKAENITIPLEFESLNLRLECDERI